MRIKRLTACILAAAIACSAALAGCGSSINEKEVGATLNGREISLGFMNFMAKFQQASYDSVYVAYFGTEYWGQEMGSEGTTMEESVKEEVAERIELMYLLEEHMADYGVEITEEDTAAITEAAKQFMSDNSSKAIKQMGAKQEYVEEMLRLNTIQQKMQTAIYEEANVEVTDEEAAQRTFSYFRASATGTTDEAGNEITYTDEEKAEFAESMKGIAEAAKQDFEGTAEEHGYNVYKYSYGSDESGMDEAVIKAADALKEGGISDLITTEEYYYVLRLDSELDEKATSNKKESLLSQKRSEYYDGICDGYKEAAEFSINEKNWAKVTFKKLFGVAMDTETAE